MFKRLVTNNVVIIASALISLAIGARISALHPKTFAFARSGAVVTLLGVILVARPRILGSGLLPVVGMADSPFDNNDPRHYRHIGVEVPDTVVQDVKSRRAVNTLGPILYFAGTIIWAFGDLIFKANS